MNQTKSRQFDLLVFDWDGTLFDSIALIVRCIQLACRDVGVPIPDDNASRGVIGLSLMSAMERIVPGLTQKQYVALVDRYRFHYFAAQHEVILYQGTRELLEKCRDEGYMLAVATGKGRRGLDEALKSVGIAQLFDATRTAEETASKPDPLMLNELMEELATSRKRTLMVGDTTHDIQMAINAGVTSVGISHGAQETAVLSVYTRAQGLLAIVHSIAEFGRWLGQHG